THPRTILPSTQKNWGGGCKRRPHLRKSGATPKNRGGKALVGGARGKKKPRRCRRRRSERGRSRHSYEPLREPQYYADPEICDDHKTWAGSTQSTIWANEKLAWCRRCHSNVRSAPRN